MSNEVMTKEKVQMDPKYIIELTLKLFVTCVVVAGLLGLVNSVTEGPIAAINKAKTEEAMKAVVADPDNSTFSEALALSEEMTAAALAGGGTLTEAYEVLVDGAPAGHALKVVASGSQGSIEMMVGLDADGVVTVSPSSSIPRLPVSVPRLLTMSPLLPVLVFWTSSRA